MLIAVRHGRTALNEAASRSWLDLPLTPLGRGEALNAAAEFQNYPHVDALHSSDFARALQTAEPISNVLGLPVQSSAALRTWHMGDHSGKPKETVREDVQRLAHSPDTPAPNGESLNSFLDRFLPAVHPMIESPQTHVLVTHGRNIQALMGLVAGHGMDVDPSAFHGEIPVKNGGLLVITPDWNATIHNPKVRAIPQLPPKGAEIGKSAFEYLTDLTGATEAAAAPLQHTTRELTDRVADHVPHALRSTRPGPPRLDRRGDPPPAV